MHCTTCQNRRNAVLVSLASSPLLFDYLFPLLFLFCLKEHVLELVQKTEWTAQKSLGPLLAHQPGPVVVGFGKCKKLSHAVKNHASGLIFVKKQTNKPKNKALQTILCYSYFEYVVSLKASFWSFSVTLEVRGVCYPVPLSLINPCATGKWGVSDPFEA